MKYKSLDFEIIGLTLSCALIFASFFMSWIDFGFAYITGYDIFRGLFRSNPGILERSMACYILIPSCLLTLISFKKKISKLKSNWLVFFLSGIFIIFLSTLNIIKFSIGSAAISSLIGSALLCAIALRMHWKKTMRTH